MKEPRAGRVRAEDDLAGAARPDAVKAAAPASTRRGAAPGVADATQDRSSVAWALLPDAAQPGLDARPRSPHTLAGHDAEADRGEEHAAAHVGG